MAKNRELCRTRLERQAQTNIRASPYRELVEAGYIDEKYIVKPIITKRKKIDKALKELEEGKPNQYRHKRLIKLTGEGIDFIKKARRSRFG
jgi:hypothetical protein